MSNTIKYLISAILVTLGIVMLIKSLSDEEVIEPSSELPAAITPLSVPINLQILGDRMDELAIQQNSAGPKILPLIVITTKVCPPCVNNMDDYAKLLKEHPLFFEPTLVFTDVEQSVAERFVAIADLDIAFELIRSEEVDSLIRESEKNLMFVDPRKQVIFHNIFIPDGIKPLTTKEGELDETAELWKSRFAENPKSDFQELNATF